MRTLIFVSTIILMSLSLAGCISRGKPINAIVTPSFVPQSPIGSTQEQGIRQDPNTGKILLEWHEVHGAQGYKVFRSDTTNQSLTPIDFVLVMNIESSSSIDDTLGLDTSPTHIGVTYYYYMNAYTSDGSSSAPSDTIHYKLLYSPITGYPANNALMDTAQAHFTWWDRTGGGYTVLRLQDISGFQPKSIWITKPFQIFEAYPYKGFDFDSVASSPLIPGHSYRWRVERFDLGGTGQPFAGSTSTWSTFLVN